MYESLVIGRSFMMYKSSLFLKNIFLQIFPTVRGSTVITAEQRFQHVLRGSMDRLVHLDIYKGGAQSEISTCTQGEYGQ